MLKIRDILLPRIQNDKWLHTQNGLYTPTSGYEWMLGTLPAFPMAKAIWSKFNIPKYSFICWLVVHGRILTKDRLMSWNIMVDNDICALCNLEVESIEHLFFKCTFSGELCRSIANWLQIKTIPVRRDDWKHWLIHLAGKTNLKAKICISGVTATIATIWKERNARVHGKSSRDVQHCFFKIKHEVSIKVLNHVIGEEKKALTKHILQCDVSS